MCVQCDVRVAEGMYLNIVVTVVCFAASVMLSLLINVFMYIATVKRVVLIFVNALYKFPLLLLSFLHFSAAFICVLRKSPTYHFRLKTKMRLNFY